MSSLEIYKKNRPILKAGKIKPIRGTKIEGKNAAVIILFLLFLFIVISKAYFTIKNIFYISQ